MTINRTLLSLIAVLAFGVSCTKKKDAEVAPAPAATETTDLPKDQLPKELPSTPDIALLPQVGGLKLAGELNRQEKQTTYINNLVVAEESGKTLDSFSELDWGAIPVTAGKDSATAVINEALTITYKVNNGKVTRTPKCKFSKPDKNLKSYDTLMKESANPETDWESFFHSEMMELALHGDKKAYDFFINPNAKAKALHANADGAASIEPILRVLNFMKDNSCKW